MTDAEEGRFVASTIFEQKMQNQMNNGQLFILYRTNAQSRSMEDALCVKRYSIPYLWRFFFYQRERNKRCFVLFAFGFNPKDEEALMRVINYPARGIGNTTIEKIIVAANHYKRSMFEVMQNIDKIDLKLNSGTKQKFRIL
jgi:DNA helicase-2/ATP-dependent DNA helicase PcrA